MSGELLQFQPQVYEYGKEPFFIPSGRRNRFSKDVSTSLTKERLQLQLVDYGFHSERPGKWGSTHITDSWSYGSPGEGPHVTHRESYNVWPNGDVFDYHYGQRGFGSSFGYNHHTGGWGPRGNLPSPF